MAVDQKVVDRIKKLLSLGDKQKNSNENEAMLALERAHAMMREHGIQMAELTAEDDEIEINIVRWSDEERSQYDTWVSIMASATAELFGCQNILFKSNAANRYRVRMCFVGEENDIELAKNVWPWLVKCCRRSATATLGSGWTSSHRSFAEAFAARIYTRSKEIAEQSKRPVTAEDHKYAMVVVAKDDALFDFMSKHFPNLTRGKKRGFRGDYDHASALAGANAGDRVNLNFRRQVGGSENLKLT